MPVHFFFTLLRVLETSNMFPVNCLFAMLKSSLCHSPDHSSKRIFSLWLCISFPKIPNSCFTSNFIWLSLSVELIFFMKPFLVNPKISLLSRLVVSPGAISFEHASVCTVQGTLPMSAKVKLQERCSHPWSKEQNRRGNIKIVWVSTSPNN